MLFHFNLFPVPLHMPNETCSLAFEGISLVMDLWGQGSSLQIECQWVAMDCTHTLKIWTEPTRVPTCLGQSTLASGGNVSIIPIKLELNLSHWPFVCGPYGFVLSFLTCATWQSSFIKELSKFQPYWLKFPQVVLSEQSICPIEFWLPLGWFAKIWQKLVHTM